MTESGASADREAESTGGTATTSAQLTAGNSAGSVDNEGVYNGIQYLGYDGVAARKLHQRILDGDAAAHETYKDPVKAAEALLNLHGGNDGRLADYTYEEAWATFNDLMPYGG